MLTLLLAGLALAGSDPSDIPPLAPPLLGVVEVPNPCASRWCADPDTDGFHVDRRPLFAHHRPSRKIDGIDLFFPVGSVDFTALPGTRTIGGVVALAPGVTGQGDTLMIGGATPQVIVDGAVIR